MARAARKTKQKTPRQPKDFYPTPEWVVHALLDEMPELIWLSWGRWLEPACGDGAIIKAVHSWADKHWPDKSKRPNWFCVDIRPECEDLILPLTPWFMAADFTEMNFTRPSNLSINRTKQFDLCLTNPSFLVAQEYVEQSLLCCDSVILLLPVHFMAAQERQEFHQEHKPDILALSKRAAFIKGLNGNSDLKEYGWWIWGKLASGRGLWRPIGPIDDKFKKNKSAKG